VQEDESLHSQSAGSSRIGEEAAGRPRRAPRAGLRRVAALLALLLVAAGSQIAIAGAAGALPLALDPLVQEGGGLSGGEEELELRDGKLVAHGALGYSVALSADGNTAIVGAPSDGDYAGAAWVFVRSGGTWSQQGPKLTVGEPPGPEAATCGEEGGEEPEGCAFGRSVAISADGNTAMIGGPRESGPCPAEPARTCRNKGAAWVFTRSGTSWSAAATLTGGPEETLEGRFGRSVALSGDGRTAVIGAPADRDGRGSAWVFTRAGSDWEQSAPKLIGGEEAGEGHFGGSVAVSGDGATAAIGAPGDGGHLGAAWVFAAASSGWAQQGAKLTGGEEVGEGRVGSAVALSSDGSTALLGGRGDAGGAGAAWVFAPSSTGWTQQGAKLTGGAQEVGEGAFGYSVALSGDGSRALLGAPRDRAAVGAAWLFARAEGTWSQEGPKLQSSGAPSSEPRKGWFGSGVALRADGRTALIGAPNEAHMAGAVWVFSDPSIIPVVETLDPSSGPTTGATAVRITGSRLAGATGVSFVFSGPGLPTIISAQSFSADSATSITALTPPHAPGNACVIVTTPEGVSQINPCAQFTYTSAPAAGGATGATGTVAAGAGGVLGFGATAVISAGCRASLISRHIMVSGSARAAVRLIWRGAGSCSGKLRLRVNRRVGRRTRVKTIATGTFVLAAGRSRTISIELNAAGRSLLRAGHGRLRASLLILSSLPAPASSASASVSLAVKHAARTVKHGG
jgi:hypothetical protein